MTPSRTRRRPPATAAAEAGSQPIPAADTHLDRFVALKILPPEKVADPERKLRFTQEAKSASSLNHPGIITIHDITSDGGVDFIVMEYVEGKTLDRLIPRTGMLVKDALKIGMEIADALAAAHAIGIVHRDIKPSNLIVSDRGRVKVLDFGLVKLKEAAQAAASQTAETPLLTDEGRILGTVYYMSPEQADGKKVDAPLRHLLVRLRSVRDGHWPASL